MTSAYLASGNRLSRRRMPSELLLLLAVFLIFGGYYSAIMLSTNIFLGEPPRIIPIGVRVVIDAILIWSFFRFPTGKLQKPLIFFIVFSAFYFIRIIHEYYTYRYYNVSIFEFFSYYILFVFIPIFVISSIRLSHRQISSIFVAAMASFLVMALLTIIFYREEIFSFSRISASISRNQNYISPLSLSYSGAMAIGVGSLYLVTNRVRLIFLIFLLATIVLSLVPFYLGASRGSIFAIVVPAIVFAIFSRGGRFKGWLIVSLFALAGAFYAAASYMGSAVFDRFMGISEAIETGSSSAARLDMWAAGLEQFVESPLLGSSLQLDLYNAYPHNIIIEALISTGLLGTVPFVMFIFACLYRSFLVARYEPQLFWIPAIFIQGLVQNMFSGAIYFASWMAVGAGLLLSLGPIRSSRRFVGGEPFSYRPQPVPPIHGAGYVSEWDGRGSRASEV